LIVNTQKLETVLEEDGIVFLTYGGFLTQSLIAGMVEALEVESSSSELSIKQSANIFTIFIELAQNMMNYSKTAEEGSNIKDPKGMIIVGKNKDNVYYVLSKNLISREDKEKVEPKLQKILCTDRDGIKKLYKEARRSGKDTHSKGGGIGFYEIAKRCSKMEFEFQQVSENRFFFFFKAVL
jgi:hypothetical protein